MKRKIAAIAALATVFTAAACSSSTSGNGGGSTSGSVLSTDGKGKTVTIWLMQDAQKGWPAVVNSANAEFEKETGAKVNIQWQTWTNFGTKLDTALLSGDAPDAIELGTTQTAKYIASNAFVDLTSVKSKFDNSSNWLDALTQTSTSADGSKLEAIPYYAGGRIMIYRKDLFAAAGVTTPPTTLAELDTDLAKVQAKNKSTANFSAMYLPGQDWYAATAFGASQFGTDGIIAKNSGGKWTGTLTDPKFEAGVQTWYNLQKKYSVGGTTVNESTQDALMAKGNIGAIIGAGWEVGSILDPKLGNPKLANDLGEIALPGVTADSPTPSFLGGSDLAVPARAKNAGLGAEWIRIFTNTQNQTTLAKFAIPNNKTLVPTFEAGGPANKALGQASLGKTWSSPNSALWSQATDEVALQNAYSAIASGKPIDASLKAAQTAILTDLNGS